MILIIDKLLLSFKIIAIHAAILLILVVGNTMHDSTIFVAGKTVVHVTHI